MNMRRSALILPALLLAFAVTPAFGDKGGNSGGGNSGNGGGNSGSTTTATSTSTSGSTSNSGSNSGTTSSSIAIASINGATLNAASPLVSPKLGDSLTFATTVQKLAGYEWPMVSLACFQDVNGDGTVGTTIGGPDQVYGELDPPSATFSLGGGSSLWLQRGGSATCRADLDAYSFRYGARVLASTGNWAVSG